MKLGMHSVYVKWIYALAWSFILIRYPFPMFSSLDGVYIQIFAARLLL